MDEAMTLTYISRSLRARCSVLLVAAALVTIPAEAASSATRVFPQPEEAAAALVSALKATDKKAVFSILGAGSRDWILTGDMPTDRKLWADFVAAYDKQHTVVEVADGRATLIVGEERYPFPFPIMHVPGGWRFDPALGKEELVNRRVGENELSTIETLKAVVDAQRDYLLADTGGQPRQYASRFASTPGKRDGLYWPAAEGEPQSPLGPLVAEAQAEGYRAKAGGGGQPYHGYRFKMLGGQGPAAVGGAQTYAGNGFAVLAWPARYGLTGVKSFLVNQEGVVFERDLGAKTESVAGKITLFNPDPGWTPVAVKP
jgi:hypothetical protein